MSDIYIYKQKAEKYKYKYLKLKQELYGGSDQYDNCTITPSILFNNKLLDKFTIEQEYPPIQTDINSFNNNNNIGRLMKYKVYEIELKNYKNKLKIINELKINTTYIPEIKYACKIKNIKSWSTTDAYKIIIEFFPKCSNRSKRSSKFAYIISTDPGKLLNDIDKAYMSSNILSFLKHLKIAIEEFIIPLHKAGYVLNNIDWNNINWDGEKVYFNISEMKQDINKNNDIKGLINSIFKLRKDEYIFILEYTNNILDKLVTDEKIIDANNLIIKLDYLIKSIIWHKKKRGLENLLYNYVDSDSDNYNAIIEQKLNEEINKFKIDNRLLLQALRHDEGHQEYNTILAERKKIEVRLRMQIPKIKSNQISKNTLEYNLQQHIKIQEPFMQYSNLQII
jgi:hypothetical protein